MRKILIIEDDKPLCNGVAIALRNDEYAIFQANTILDARRIMNEQNMDIIILDVNLPDGNGVDFLTQIRKESSISIIMLTANDMETDIVAGLEQGADDYITKPFSLAVLRARVNTQLRKKDTPSSKVHIDMFSFDFEHMEFMKGINSVELSKNEQKLLKILVDNRGQILSREILVDRIWTDGAEFVEENALSVCVKRLRDKLENNPSKPAYIKTVYGIGYTWESNK